MKESISVGWIVAFFLVGILLGLWGLSLLDSPAPATQGVPAQEVVKRSPRNDEGQGRSQPQRRAVATEQRSEETSSAKAEAPAAGEVPSATSPAEAPVAPVVAEPLNCNLEAAERVRERARTVAEIAQHGELVIVRLRGEWDYYSENVRRSFVARFADSDACLNGRSRPIDFYYKGVLYAHADPDKGIVFP